LLVHGFQVFQSLTIGMSVALLPDAEEHNRCLGSKIDGCKIKKCCPDSERTNYEDNLTELQKELQGAVVIQSKQCRNCHSLGGTGGQRGPALDGVGAQLTGDQLVRQVIQARI
jgi:hypothetical protein